MNLTYDNTNEPTSIGYAAAGASCATIANGKSYQSQYVVGSCSSPGSPVGNVVYTDDGAGRVAGRCGAQFNSVIANAVQSGSCVVNATYDIGDRLTSWTTPGGTTSFFYDANGNGISPRHP